MPRGERRTAAPRRFGNALIERLPRAQLDAMVERAVLRKIAQAQETVPFYRWFYRKHAFDAAGLRSLREFREKAPPAGKADLIEFQDETRVLPVDEGTRQLHLTSGTSGVGREFHPRTQDDIAALGTSGAYEFAWAGLGPGDRVMLTMPYSQTMAGPYFVGACQTTGIVPIAAFLADTGERIEQLYRFECNGIVATPSYLHRLTIAARAAGRVPATDLPSLRAIFISGEPYGLEWAAQTAKFWGATLFEGWGATQTLGVAMATCQFGSLRHAHGTGQPERGVLHGLDHRCFIEVLGPGSVEAVSVGEAGEIVVTTLRTSGMPCIRFRMRDRVRVLPSGACPCGSSFSCHEAGTISRLDDMIKIRGMNVWPSAVDEVVLCGPVVEYAGRVFTDDGGRESVQITVETTLAPAEHGPFAAELSRRIRSRTGIGVDVVMSAPGTLQETQFKSRRWRDERAVQA